MFCRNAVFMSNDSYIQRLDAIMAKAIWRPFFRAYYPHPCPENLLPQVWLYRLVCHWDFYKYKPISLISWIGLGQILGCKYIFDSSFFCCFQVMIRGGNHYAFLVTKCMFIITCWSDFFLAACMALRVLAITSLVESPSNAGSLSFRKESRLGFQMKTSWSGLNPRTLY